MKILILLLPLIGSISAGLLGRFLGGNGAGYITISSLTLTLLLILHSFYHYIKTGFVSWYQGYTWIEISHFNISFGLLLDGLSLIMLVLVVTVSLLVHIYSTEYMRLDPHLPRFMSYLSLFTFFMIVLVTSNNFIQLFVGWEGVGLCSYLLVNFWFTRVQANTSAIKAVTINRIGDFALLIGIGLLFTTYQSFEYSVIFSLIPLSLNVMFLNTSIPMIEIIGFFLLAAAVGKSAQIGLHTWLPDAMEGPTPVSALIHAATMVTAGIFLIIRSSPLFEFTFYVLSVMTFFGIATASAASIAAMFQFDLKKVIAYSTCSQLGYMLFTAGLSQYALSLYHLWNHGFFKALLFLSAGAIIHATRDEQDMRRLGGLYWMLPFTYTMMVIGVLALTGFPFLAGFYSKDAILATSYGSYIMTAQGTFWCASMMTLGTSLYSFQLLYFLFIKPTSMFKSTIKYVSESSFSISFALFMLSFLSIFIGYLTEDMFIGLGSPFWGNAIFIHPYHTIVDFEFLPTIVLLTPTLFSLLGCVIVSILYEYQHYVLVNSILLKKVIHMVLNSQHVIALSIRRTFNFLYFASKYRIYSTFLKPMNLDLARDFYKNVSFDEIYNGLVVSKFLYFGYHISFKMLDRGIFEFVGPYGLSKITLNETLKMSRFYSGHLFDYVYPLFFVFLMCVFVVL